MAEIGEPSRQEPLQVPAPWRYPAPVPEHTPKVPEPAKTFTAIAQGIPIVYTYTGEIDRYACEHEWEGKLVQRETYLSAEGEFYGLYTALDNIRECVKCGLYTLYGIRQNNLYCETNARYVE